jgi:hypothetical protein
MKISITLAVLAILAVSNQDFSQPGERQELGG